MINLEVSEIFILDLLEDFLMNSTLDLYGFLNKDLVKAYWLGYHIREWFEKLTKEQQYLYSKQIRHNRDDLEQHLKQIEFWTSKFPDKEATMGELSQFILNNMIWENEKIEESDSVKLAFFFGQSSKMQENKDE